MKVEERKDDTELKELLAALLTIVKEFGPRSKEVKSFILEHKDVPEFLQLAATCIFMIEDHNTVTRDDSIRTTKRIVQWVVMAFCVFALIAFVSPLVGLVFGIGWITGFVNGAW